MSNLENILPHRRSAVAIALNGNLELTRRSFGRLVGPQESLNAGDMGEGYSRTCCGRMGVIKLE